MPKRLVRKDENSLPPGVKPAVSEISKLKTWKSDKHKSSQRKEQMEYIMKKLPADAPLVYVDEKSGKVIQTSRAETEKKKREEEREKWLKEKQEQADKEYEKKKEKMAKEGGDWNWKAKKDQLSATAWQNPLAMAIETEPKKDTLAPVSKKGKTWNSNFDNDKSEERKEWVKNKGQHDELMANVEERLEKVEEMQKSKEEVKQDAVRRAIPQQARLWPEQPKKEMKRKFEKKPGGSDANKRQRTEPELKKFNSKGKPIKQYNSTDSKDAKPYETDAKEDRVAQKVGRAKLIWNEARIKEKKPEERSALIDKLMKIIGDDIKGFIYKHDGSRILQTCLKYGTLEQKKKLLTELLPETLNIAQHEFSHFLAIKIFKYSDQQQRMQFLTKIHGQVLRIFKYKFGAKIIERVYEDGNTRVKQSLLAEFYGREFALFKQNEVPKNLREILKASSPEKQQKIMESIKEMLVSLLSSKGEALVGHTVLHKVIWEYLSNADPKGIREVVSVLESLLLLFIHTHEGAKCGAYCFLYGNPKERKSMLKALKDHVPTIATSPYAYLVVLTALARVDDTTLSTKSILQPLLGMLADLALEATSSRIPLLTLTAPSMRYFTQEELDLIEHDAKVPQEGNPENLVATSLKDPATRRAQLADYLSAPLAEACVARVMELMVSKSGANVLFEIIKAGRFEVLRAVLDIIERSDTTPPDDDEEEDGKANGKGKGKGQQEEEEEEFYWTSKPSTMLLGRLIKELPEKEKAELLEKLVASFGDNILHWAVKSSNASYLIKDILEHVDTQTQQKLAKLLASAAPDTRIGRAVAEIKSKTTTNGKQKPEPKAANGKKAAAKKEEKPAPKKGKKVEEQEEAHEEEPEQTEGAKRKRPSAATTNQKRAKKPTK